MSCNHASHLSHSFSAASANVVIGSMHPWSPSSYYNATADPVVKKGSIFVSIYILI